MPQTSKPRAFARSASARPVRPRPTTPSRVPPIRRSSPAAVQSQPPARTSRSSSDDAAQQGQDERERMVGDLLDAVVGHVADPDAAPLGLVHVEVVEADAAGGDHAQRRQTVEVVRPYLGLGADEEADDVFASPRLPALGNGHAGPRQERTHTLRVVDLVSDDDTRLASRGHGPSYYHRPRPVGNHAREGNRDPLERPRPVRARQPCRLPHLSRGGSGRVARGDRRGRAPSATSWRGSRSTSGAS